MGLALSLEQTEMKVLWPLPMSNKKQGNKEFLSQHFSALLGACKHRLFDKHNSFLSFSSFVFWDCLTFLREIKLCYFDCRKIIYEDSEPIVWPLCWIPSAFFSSLAQVLHRFYGFRVSQRNYEYYSLNRQWTANEWWSVMRVMTFFSSLS